MPLKLNITNGNIEWAKYTWNPITGCLSGCLYCFARDIAMRFPGNYPKGFEPDFHEDRLDRPGNTKPPKTSGENNIFVCSMADMFGPWVPDEWIEKVFDVVEDNPQWNFLFLTKNPKRYIELTIPENCWLGATADTQARMDIAVEAFSKMHKDNIFFLSCEPLLESIDISRGKGLIDWVIIGGQSKTSGAPAFQPDWEWVYNLMTCANDIGAEVYWKPNLTVRPKGYPDTTLQEVACR